jgi:hypothetical protein
MGSTLLDVMICSAVVGVGVVVSISNDYPKSTLLRGPTSHTCSGNAKRVAHCDLPAE